MKSIGIDIGTTSISGVVLEDGAVIYKKTVNSDSFIKSDYTWERIQDVSIIIEKAKGILDECLNRYSDVTRIGLTGQMHGIVYVDDCGQAISPLYTWQDGRAEPYLTEMGEGVASGYGLASHIANMKMNLVPNEMACMCTIMDYFGMVLCGLRRPIMHVSNGASLGFWDLKKNDFKWEKLKELHVLKTTLPEVVSSICTIGTYREVPVLVALGDNQASFLGSVGMQADVVLVNMGTGGQVSMMTQDYRCVEGIETRPYIDGTYLLVGASLCGGRAYAILEKFFRDYVREATGIDEVQYDVMSRLVNGATGLSVTTTFNGTRMNPQQLGSIQNLSESNFTASDLIYGFMEGMVRELFEMYQTMSLNASSLMASGNGVRKNEHLQRIITDMFALPIHMAMYEEEAACGAALSYLYVKE